MSAHMPKLWLHGSSVILRTARGLLLLPMLLAVAADTSVQVRDEIVAGYQHALEALRRGDADAAFQMDTQDWVSVVVGQNPRTRQEMEPLIRRDIAGMKPPAEWRATWRPDYERNGTTSGIQIYDVKVEGDRAVVLCLVGSTRTQLVEGSSRQFWRGSHVRDTWIKTPAGWKRRMHEKLTIDERMIDGHAATQ